MPPSRPVRSSSARECSGSVVQDALDRHTREGAVPGGEGSPGEQRQQLGVKGSGSKGRELPAQDEHRVADPGVGAAGNDVITHPGVDDVGDQDGCLLRGGGSARP